MCTTRFEGKNTCWPCSPANWSETIQTSCDEWSTQEASSPETQEVRKNKCCTWTDSLQLNSAWVSVAHHAQQPAEDPRGISPRSWLEFGYYTPGCCRFLRQLSKDLPCPTAFCNKWRNWPCLLTFALSLAYHVYSCHPLARVGYVECVRGTGKSSWW